MTNFITASMAPDLGGGASIPTPAALVIPLDTAANGKLMASQTLTAASAITFSGAVEQGNCTFCLIGDGNSAHVPDFDAWKLGNNYAYDYTAGVKNIYAAIYAYGVPFLYGTGSGVGSVATVPDAPAIGAATAGDGTASVAFTPPSSNGGAAISAYTVTMSPSGVTATGPSSPIVVTGLANGAAQTAKVKATNIVGTGAESAASNSVTPSAGGGSGGTITPTLLGSRIGSTVVGTPNPDLGAALDIILPSGGDPTGAVGSASDSRMTGGVGLTFPVATGFTNSLGANTNLSIDATFGSGGKTFDYPVGTTPGFASTHRDVAAYLGGGSAAQSWKVSTVASTERRKMVIAFGLPVERTGGAPPQREFMMRCSMTGAAPVDVIFNTSQQDTVHGWTYLIDFQPTGSAVCSVELFFNDTSNQSASISPLAVALVP